MQGVGPGLGRVMPGVRTGCTEGSNQADTQISYWGGWGTGGRAPGPLTAQLVHWRCFRSPAASSRQAAPVGRRRARCAGPAVRHLPGGPARGGWGLWLRCWLQNAHSPTVLLSSSSWSSLYSRCSSGGRLKMPSAMRFSSNTVLDSLVRKGGGLVAPAHEEHVPRSGGLSHSPRSPPSHGFFLRCQGRLGREGLLTALALRGRGRGCGICSRRRAGVWRVHFISVNNLNSSGRDSRELLSGWFGRGSPKPVFVPVEEGSHFCGFAGDLAPCFASRTVE